MPQAADNDWLMSLGRASGTLSMHRSYWPRFADDVATGAGRQGCRSENVDRHAEQAVVCARAAGIDTERQRRYDDGRYDFRSGDYGQ